jgi:hypothetical protein
VRRQCDHHVRSGWQSKLDKKRASGRIDGMPGLAMALAAAPPTWTTPIDVAALIG